MTAPQTWQEWAGLDYSPIPLVPGSKEPLCANWQYTDFEAQWAHASPGANVGLRCGGELRFVVIDTDEPQTARNVGAWLAGLGYYGEDAPTVTTPSEIGRHFYATLTEPLPGHWRSLSPSIGAGELRYGVGAQVGAPPSTVNGHAYRLIAGDVRQLPKLSRAEVAQLLKPGKLDEPEPLPAPQAQGPRHVSSRAWALLHGKGVDVYPSRSEAEAAIVASLIATGNSFDAVLSLFVRHQCAGKFAELNATKPQTARQWLALTYRNAARFVNTHESAARTNARLWWTWAGTRPWAGRTGATDHAVFTALTTIAARTGKAVFGASRRELAELAGVGGETATNATRRLIDANLLLRAEIAHSPAKIAHSPAATFSLPVSSVSSAITCSPVIEWLSLNIFAGDVWRVGALGKSGADVWRVLAGSSSGLTARYLANETGRSVSTVTRVLGKMLSARMVEKQNTQWRAVGDVDLERAAVYFGTAGKGAKQKAKHTQDRAKRKNAIARLKCNRLNGGESDDTK